MKKGKPINQKAQDVIKNAVTRMIQNISIIAIFIAIGVVTLAYSGAEFIFNIEGGLTGRIVVSSVLLMISNIVLYELWMRNGQQKGREEKSYIDTLSEFEGKSKNIHSGTMQNFIEWEAARRFDVEKRKLNKEIEKLTEKLKQKDLSEKAKADIIIRRQKLQDHIIEIDMPYKVAEEFDELRYSVNDSKMKEYKPDDTRKFLKKHRIQKYILTATFTTFSINLIVMGTMTGDWWSILLAVSMAIITIVISIVIGFSNGYSAIMVSSLGVYKTANDFIDKALGWCQRKNISLYYTEEACDFSVYALDNLDPDIEEPEDYYKPTLKEAFPEPVGALELNNKREIIIE